MAHNHQPSNNYPRHTQHGVHSQELDGQYPQHGTHYGGAQGLQRFNFPEHEYYQFAQRDTHSNTPQEPPYGQPTATQSHVRQSSSGGMHQIGQAQVHTGSYNGAYQQPVQQRPQFPKQSAQQAAPYYNIDANVGRRLASGSPAYRKPLPQQMPLRATQTSSPAGYQSSVRAPPPSAPSSTSAPNAYQNQRTRNPEQLPQTVDPSQFHDSYLENQRRKAAAAAQEEAARKEAEEKRRQYEEEQERLAESRRQADENRRKVESEKLAQQAAPEQAAPEQAQAASAQAAPTPAGLEAEMRAMFLKLREYNQKDPELLSKLWAQERENHLASQAPDQAQTSKPPPAKPQPAPRPENAPAKTTKDSGPASKKGRPRKDPNEPYFSADLTALASKPAATGQTTSANKSSSQTKVPPPPVNAPPASDSSIVRSSPSMTWPADKKVLLSAAASNLVQSMPENRGRTLLPSDVAAMLDKNPSYVELCDSIEKLGFKLNRAAFAKGLLAVVPDNSAKLSQASPTARQFPSASPTPLTPGSGNAVNTVPAQSSFTKSKAVTPSTQSENSQAPLRIVVSGKVLGPVHPPTKEAASRKRTFADLVDLTQLSDEEPAPLVIEAESQPPVAKDGFSKFRLQPPAASNPMPTSTSTSTQDASAKKLSESHPLKIQGAVKPLDRHRAIRRSKYHPKTIARDVLLACGRHPNMQPLNTHLERMKGNPLKLPDDADLDTLRWDLIDPMGLPVGSGMPNDADLVEESDGFADDESRSGSESEVEIVSQAPAAGNVGGAVTATVSTPRNAPNPISIKKRAGPIVHIPTQGARQHAPTPKSGTPSSYSELRDQAQQTGAPARRGRPVGWRKWMQKSPSSNPNKPPLNLAKKPPASPPEPNFPEFKCEWEGCDRSLHNLDTLRHHIFKIHDKPDGAGQRKCQWEECGRIEIVRDEHRASTRKVRETLPNRKQWKAHIESAHLNDIAWRLGDGPTAGLARHPESAIEHSDAFLSDRDGRQVTPRVELPPTRGFTAVNAVPPRDTAASRAREEVRAAEERRARMGAGIDHEGARSVDDEMRDTMKDDGDSDTPAIEILNGDDPMEF